MPRLAPQPGPTKYLVAAIRERVNVRVNVKLDMRPPRVRARLGHRRGKPSSSSSTSDAGSSCRASRSTTLFFSSSRAISCASPWRAALLPMRPPAPPLTGAALALPGTSGTSGTLCDSCSGGFWAAAASRAASVDVAAAVDMFTSVFSARCLGAAGAVTFPGLRGSGAKACGCGAAAAGAAPQSGDLSLSAASSSSSPSSTALLSAPCCDVTCPTSRRSSEIVCCFARRVFWSRRFFCRRIVASRSRRCSSLSREVDSVLLHRSTAVARLWRSCSSCAIVVSLRLTTSRSMLFSFWSFSLASNCCFHCSFQSGAVAMGGGVVVTPPAVPALPAGDFCGSPGGGSTPARNFKPSRHVLQSSGEAHTKLTAGGLCPSAVPDRSTSDRALCESSMASSALSSTTSAMALIGISCVGPSPSRSRHFRLCRSSVTQHVHTRSSS
mmetsp:Transcript_114305/g.323767  ORF Transcript_114305/g.323767 Transcript_114305/m.323767 type:complete len:439 (+) Transcript_114305:113-1429(+)